MRLIIEVPDVTEIISVTAFTAEDTEKGVELSAKTFIQTLNEFAKAEDGNGATPEEKAPKEDDPPWE